MSASAPCPICGGSAELDHGHDVEGVGALLDATCNACGWHFTSPQRRVELDLADELLAENPALKR